MKEQLEVFKIVMKGANDTFRKLISTKYGRTRSNKETDIFLQFFRQFIAGLDKKVWKVDNKLQAITILKPNKIQITKQIVTPHSEHFVIEGYIDGGNYDMLRSLTSLNDTSNSTQITKDKMVSDRYYFYFYVKPDEKIALLMIEKKGTLSISRVVCKYIESLLKVTNEQRCKIQRYIPQFMINEFKKGAIVDNIICTDEFAKQVYSSDGTVLRNSHYTVTVKIQPKDDADRQRDSSYLKQQLNNIKVVFHYSSKSKKEKTLIDFTNKKGVLKDSSGKSCTFDLEDEDAIKPVIEIADEMLSDEKDVLKRNEIRDFCNEILNQLKEEVYAVSL